MTVDAAVRSAKRSRRRRRRRGVAMGVGCIAVVLIASTAALSTLRHGRLAIDTIGAPSSTSDRLDAVLLVRDVDTARQEAKLRLYIDPVGALADREGGFAKRIVVDSSNESGSLLTAEQGDSTLISDFVSTFDRGEDVSYPFDSYRSTLWLNATTDDGQRVPIRLRFEAADSNFRFDVARIDIPDSSIEPTFDLTVDRSGLTKVLVMLVVVLMWALAAAVGSVAWLVATRSTWRQRSFEILGWLAAMLFALIQLRGVAPDAPGFGTLFDFVGFFWAELITAVSLCAIVAVMIRSELP